MMFAFLRWFLFVVIVGVGCSMATYAGVPKMIYEADSTMLSFVIITACVGMSLRCGFFTYKASEEKDLDKLRELDISKETGWVTANLCSQIGLVGTVIGFIMALRGLHGVDFSDTLATQHVMSAMAGGIGVALWTTLVGQGSRIILTLQYSNLSQYVEQKLLKLGNDSTMEVEPCIDGE